MGFQALVDLQGLQESQDNPSLARKAPQVHRDLQGHPTCPTEIITMVVTTIIYLVLLDHLGNQGRQALPEKRRSVQKII